MLRQIFSADGILNSFKIFGWDAKYDAIKGRILMALFFVIGLVLLIFVRRRY